jgi:hypothetical protein
MEEIQLDFKDTTSVPPDPDGKQQHVVEMCHCVDAGPSTWLMAEARADFHAVTAQDAVLGFLTRYGCPCRMTFDRDSRWVGSHSLRHFPESRLSLLVMSGHPASYLPAASRLSKNAYVERLHHTLNQEWGPRPPAHHAW